jgi:Tol biopolymer transport system component
MSLPPSNPTPDVDTSAPGERLESWKEIAVYLNRSVRTLHRWEKEEGLPVHRQLHKELGSVFAYKSELDAWSRARSVRPDIRENTGDLRSANRYRMKRVAIVVTLAVVSIASFWYLLTRGSRSEESRHDAPVARLELISTFSGSHRWPSLSPDGRRFAFISDVGGTPQVWIKTIAPGEPVQLTFGASPASRPRWSPDGDSIVFSVVGHGIWAVPSVGGQPRRIVEDGSNADVSPHGRHIVFERGGEVFIAGIDGSDVRPLQGTRRQTPYPGESWPTFSPDGTSVALFVAEEGRYGDYWILSLTGAEARRVTWDFQEGGAPAWMTDGASLVVRSSRAGSANLWRVPVAGGTPERLTSGAGEDLDPVLSADGRTVLFANVKRTWELIVQDLHSGERRTVLEQRTLLLFPRFSPDGRRIALSGRNSRGETHVFMMDADGSNLRPVTDGTGELNIMPQWGLDGDHVYFYQIRPAPSFRRVSLSGGPSREIAPWSLRRHYQAAVDPRERRAIYSSIEHGELQQSRARDLETGSETRLPFALYEQRFSPDGRWIAGESRDHELVVCEMSGGCRPLTPKADRGLTALAWSADSTRLMFLRHTSQRVWGELTSIGVAGGAEQSHGLVGPFEHDFQMFMDVSSRNQVVFALCREGPYELWRATLR